MPRRSAEIEGIFEGADSCGEMVLDLLELLPTMVEMPQRLMQGVVRGQDQDVEGLLHARGYIECA